MRRSHLALALGLVLYSGRPAWADEAAAVATEQLGLERRKSEPISERKIESRAPSTLKTKAAERVRSRQSQRVALQIPAALRERAMQKVEARITRNVARARELRLEALGMLYKLLAELPPGASELPTTLMRLGELEWEEERDAFLVEFARWERTPSERRAEPPVPDYARPRARFQRVLAEHPDFERYDLALYVDGFLATEEGHIDQALVAFNRILAEYPSSPFVPDAHMVRAEAEFSLASPNYQLAYQEYEAVLAHPGTELHDLALFKSAWALWRLGQTDEAARRFLSVFKASAEGAPATGQRREELDQLQAEALKNLVAVFVEDEKNTADDMHGFLVQAGGERFAGEIVRALAETLFEQAHYTRGIEAYRLLIRLSPTHPAAYEHALAIALGHSTLEMWDELQKDYAWVLEEYVQKSASEAGSPGKITQVTPSQRAPAGAAAPSAPGGDRPSTSGAWLAVTEPATLAQARAAIERRLYDDAVGLHAKAQADRTSRVEFEAAAGLYASYLSRFGDSPQAYEVQFNRGEICFHRLGQPEAAADAYLAAVRIKPDGPWSRDALYNALAALESAREVEFQAAKAAGERQRETPIDKKLTQAMELYSSTYPDDPELPGLLFRQGRLYYDYELYDPAVRQWGLLLEKYAQSSHARAAGELILDSFNKSRDYENIETWGRRLLEAPAFAEPKAQARLRHLIVLSIFKQGEQLSADGQHAPAAGAYLRAAREFPEDDRAAQSAVNAAIEAERAVDLAQLADAAALLAERHRTRPEAARGIWIAASLHQSLGLLSEAAEYHDLLAKTWPKDERHEDASYNAVLLHTTLGQRDAAVAAGERFQRQYQGRASTDEVTFLMGKAHEQAEDWRAAERLYARYASSAKLASRRIEALVRLAVARVELNDDRGAREALERATAQHKTYAQSLDERGKYFGARAHFLQAQRILAEFERIKIEGDVKLLGQRLKRKAELLKRASVAFLDTAKLGVAEWTTASLYEVGSIYESFARALMSSPAPPTLSPEQAEEYRMQIDEFVVPIEEKSIEAYESGWEKALELGIFNAWTGKMREALGRLNTQVYPPISEVGFRLRSEGAARLPELIPGTRRTEAGKSQDYLIAAPKRAARAEPESSIKGKTPSERMSRASRP